LDPELTRKQERSQIIFCMNGKSFGIFLKNPTFIEKNLKICMEIFKNNLQTGQKEIRTFDHMYVGPVIFQLHCRAILY